MDALLGLLKGIAPTLATMVAGPLGGAAVSLIANKLGVEDAVSEVAKAIVGDPLAAQKIKEMELEFAKVEAANVADARALQVAALQQEDLFSKRFIYYFATVWSVFAMVYFSFATFGTIPESAIVEIQRAKVVELEELTARLDQKEPPIKVTVEGEKVTVSKGDDTVTASKG